MKEIIYKYKSHATRLLRLMENIYSWLPVASLIDDHVFVAHGGISDITDLHKINQLKRQKVGDECELRFSLRAVFRSVRVRAQPELHHPVERRPISNQHHSQRCPARMATSAGLTLERSEADRRLRAEHIPRRRMLLGTGCDRAHPGKTQVELTDSIARMQRGRVRLQSQ